MEFTEFDKIARLNRQCTITEKIDGTNATVYIGEDGEVLAGSRTRWLTPDNDNFGFARWVEENREPLVALLGPGWHRGEWWGQGIQRRYGMPKKFFSLFNSERWSELPCNPVESPDSLVYRVPVLYTGLFSTAAASEALLALQTGGSRAAPFMDPEGIVIYHHAARQYFKATIKGDDEPKSKGASR